MVHNLPWLTVSCDMWSHHKKQPYCGVQSLSVHCLTVGLRQPHHGTQPNYRIQTYNDTQPHMVYSLPGSMASPWNTALPWFTASQHPQSQLCTQPYGASMFPYLLVPKNSSPERLRQAGTLLSILFASQSFFIWKTRTFLWIKTCQFCFSVPSMDNLAVSLVFFYMWFFFSRAPLIFCCSFTSWCGDTSYHYKTS